MMTIMILVQVTSQSADTTQAKTRMANLIDLIDWSIDWWMDGCIDSLIDWLIDWLIDGWTDGWMDGWMDGWIDGLSEWLHEKPRNCLINSAVLACNVSCNVKISWKKSLNWWKKLGPHFGNFILNDKCLYLGQESPISKTTVLVIVATQGQWEDAVWWGGWPVVSGGITLRETSPSKWMVGRWFISFWGKKGPIFRCFCC